MTQDVNARTSSMSDETPDSPPSSVEPSRLGEVVVADFEALRNDLRQAQLLAADYRWQLAGKSNECAELRYLLEKTQSDFTKLQNDVGELRRERHRLANEAMRVKGLEFLEEENVVLRKEIEKLKGALQTALGILAQTSAEKAALEQQPGQPKVIELDFNF